MSLKLEQIASVFTLKLFTVGNKQSESCYIELKFGRERKKEDFHPAPKKPQRPKNRPGLI